MNKMTFLLLLLARLQFSRSTTIVNTSYQNIVASKKNGRETFLAFGDLGIAVPNSFEFPTSLARTKHLSRNS